MKGGPLHPLQLNHLCLGKVTEWDLSAPAHPIQVLPWESENQVNAGGNRACLGESINDLTSLVGGPEVGCRLPDNH